LSPKKPFKLSGLPRLTRQQVALHESVLTYLSARPASATFAQDLGKLLSQELRVPTVVSGATVATVSRQDLPALWPEVGCFAVIGLGPGPHKIIVDVEPALGAWSIERLLGGAEPQAGASHVARAPTDMEAGVLSYLLLHVLSFFSTGLRGGQELALMLDRVVGHAQALEEFLADEDYINVGARIEAGPLLGSVRLLIPAALITAHFGAPVADSHPNALQLALMRRRLHALPDQVLEGRVVGAHLALSQDDMDSLEIGDIIILENHELKAKADVGLSGAVNIVMGQGRHGHIAARLFDEAGSARLEVQTIVQQNEPSGGAMSDDKPASDNLPETEGLLREMDRDVAVELGRIRLNTAQVVRLRAGQVLHLNRGATDPVDLVIGGKLFAKGELLEVDGELGVRLTQLTGEP
jgi:flagellar motor switch protein FliM